MCTVTYLPLGNNDFILTSNRDETPKRATIAPQTYVEDGVGLTYPKDQLAGGTWIGLSEKKRLICLLNGAFEKHQRASSYKMSRGVVVKKLLKVDDAVTEIQNFDFNDIEPFTIVLVDWKESLKAYELVWDGKEKHFEELGGRPRIWSSSTLYNEEMKQLRREWFADWLVNNPEFNQDAILRFHKDETKGDVGVSLKMRRENVETVSITSVKKQGENVGLDYFDFVNEELLSI